MSNGNPLSEFFHRGDKQNAVHYKTYCKACVKKHMEAAGSPMTDILTKGQSYLDGPWIAHILGGRTACPNASVEAKAEATAQRKEASEAKEVKKHPRSDTPDPTEPKVKKRQTQSTLTTYRRNDMPYAAPEIAAVQRQALRAIVSGGLPLGAFREPEMLVLFGMLRSTAPEIMPTGKVVGGRLLNDAAEEVELKTEKALKDKDAGLSTDGWKCKKKDSVNAICANVDYKSHLLELIEVTALNKDGTAQCELFEDMIDRAEKKPSCKIRYFTTEADGGSKKGRLNLGKKRYWLILPSCWAHQFQLILGDYFKVNDMAAAIAEDATDIISWLNNHGKVRKIFDASQKTISMMNVGHFIILAYLVANITRWTTHFVAFCRLLLLKEALQHAVYTRRKDIIDAQVGAAVSTEGERLRSDAEKYCALIKDEAFWSGLETILGDLEPICLGTNINQRDSTRPDQVLLTIAGIFLHFSDHPEEEVKSAMLTRIEKRWKDCDQPVFLAALILNPFEKMACFGPNANLNQIKSLHMVILLYRRVMSRPDNPDTPDERKAKEAQVSKAFVQYLKNTGDFVDFNPTEWEEIHESTDPVMAWEALAGSKHIAELAQFAIIILQVVANQAGCERTFSRTKIEQSNHRVRLGLPKIEKRTKIRAEIHSEHIKNGLCKPRKNHKSTATLLSVPRYQDLLGDQDDEDPTERGRALVSSAAGWRTEMAKWIADARAAEREEHEEDDEGHPEEVVPKRLPAWKPLTLETLFGEAKPRKRKPSVRVMEEEEILMEQLADAAEDEVPDDGGIEIDSDDEFRA
ncbi:ribonuclease H-like domain-containing protein [Mycena leptocephala]|nr:ribonuclease H-like domain-containing protein [Mycena leptocephala]